MKKIKDNSYIQNKVLELNSEQPWNHNIILPGNIETRPGNQMSHGKNLVKWNRIEPIIDLLGIANKNVVHDLDDHSFLDKVKFQLSEID